MNKPKSIRCAHCGNWRDPAKVCHICCHLCRPAGEPSGNGLAIWKSLMRALGYKIIKKRGKR